MPFDWEYRFDSPLPTLCAHQTAQKQLSPSKYSLRYKTKLAQLTHTESDTDSIPKPGKRQKQWIASDRIGGSKSTNPKNPNTTSLRTAQREMDCDSDSQISTSPKIKNRSWASRFAEEPRFTETIRVTTLTWLRIPTWWKFCRNKVSFVRFYLCSTRFVF